MTGTDPPNHPILRNQQRRVTAARVAANRSRPCPPPPRNSVLTAAGHRAKPGSATSDTPGTPPPLPAENPRWLAGPATRIRHLAVAIAPAPHLSGQRHGHPPLGDTEFAEAIWRAPAGPLQKLASRPDQSRFSSCPAAAEFADNLECCEKVTPRPVPPGTKGRSGLQPIARPETSMASSPPALLVLEDGRTFHGRAFGAIGETFGEAVFATGMSGYQET